MVKSKSFNFTFGRKSVKGAKSNNDEPPEITYCVVGGEGGLALQAVVAVLFTESFLRICNRAIFQEKLN
ncbi:Disheveled-associated activator of morphogenesis 1 [Operophtera brumata]|uniref:Disheveled-associated activator of morphogenesis 1 n=1 Tax=Operophtera brumata TaxID=104452 RepID=A0A0L7L3Q4_OPEBR|nr:Disheveled-associated activator of morphogenesis 1 [Operophtera brumata]